MTLLLVSISCSTPDLLSSLPVDPAFLSLSLVSSFLFTLYHLLLSAFLPRRVSSPSFPQRQGNGLCKHPYGFAIIWPIFDESSLTMCHVPWKVSKYHVLFLSHSNKPNDRFHPLSLCSVTNGHHSAFDPCNLSQPQLDNNISHTCTFTGELVHCAQLACHTTRYAISSSPLSGPPPMNRHSSAVV
jgi:hypothetical protein